MKIVSVVGARPQFIKAAALSRKLRKRNTEVMLHTGQHYDYGMSKQFFEELDLPPPEVNLRIGSGSHGAQTGQMLAGIEEVLSKEQPDWALVYGDTNSTLAGSLAAAKLDVPVAHVEAGLRSFNRRMPEEINRVLTDHVSALLFCPSQTAVDNLVAEGIRDGVHLVGDIMADMSQFAQERARSQSDILAQQALPPGGYALVTVHRAENTDAPERMAGILAALDALDLPVVFPVHPRTRKALEARSYRPAPHVHLLEPAGYLDMVMLEQAARVILTDSGGVQKEAYWSGVPCVTLRDETEWVETVEHGWNALVGADREAIVGTVRDYSPPEERPPLYGDGQAGNRCVALLEEHQA